MVKKLEFKNFYISALSTGITSFLLGLFYTLFKDATFEKGVDDFLEGTGVLASYITSSTGKPSETNYFLIGFLCALIFFFLISFLLHLYLKKDYIKIFNMLSSLNVILSIFLILSCTLTNISVIVSCALLVIGLILYLVLLYKKLNDIPLKQKIISLVVFALLIFLILIFLKLFV